MRDIFAVVVRLAALSLTFFAVYVGNGGDYAKAAYLQSLAIWAWTMGNSERPRD